MRTPTLIKGLLAALLLAALPALVMGAGPAPQYSQTQTFSAFVQVARAPNLTTGASTGNVALGASAGVAVVFNTGAQLAYVALGSDNTVTVSAANGVPIQPGSCVSLSSAGMTYIAGISPGGASTIVTSLGTGWMGGCGGSASITGTVTANPPAATPTAGTASAIVTGGTAVTLITGPVNGCYVTNPLAATDQNIAAAEVAYVNPVTTATSNGRGTNSTLQPGDTFICPAGMTTNLSAIAATTAHALTVVKW